jgi:hypothetical protein
VLNKSTLNLLKLEKYKVLNRSLSAQLVGNFLANFKKILTFCALRDKIPGHLPISKQAAAYFLVNEFNELLQERVNFFSLGPLFFRETEDFFFISSNSWTQFEFLVVSNFVRQDVKLGNTLKEDYLSKLSLLNPHLLNFDPTAENDVHTPLIPALEGDANFSFSLANTPVIGKSRPQPRARVSPNPQEFLITIRLKKLHPITNPIPILIKTIQGIQDVELINTPLIELICESCNFN